MKSDLLPTSPARRAPSQREVSVLVLDDDGVDIEAVTRCLRSLEGWTVNLRSAQTLSECRRSLWRRPADVLFIDYRLGALTGPEALGELRASGYDGPAILLSGMHGEAVLVEAMQAGFVDYLPKDELSRGSVRRALGLVMDRVDLTAELKRTSRALSETVRCLVERQQEVASFYHNVSHELKTPLTGVREYVSLLLDGAAGDVTEDQARLLESAVRNCDQMVTCINDMLDASRIETGKLAVNRRPTDLVAVIEDSLQSCSCAARRKEVEVHFTGAVPGLVLDIDPQRIYQVMTNLLGNAIKFSEPGTRVTCRLDSGDANEVALEVSDRGCGIDAGEVGRVFDRLYQAQEGHSVGLGGLGMGLYIVKGIVEGHGGTISVRSVKGEGSTFRVTLPRVPGPGTPPRPEPWEIEGVSA